MSVALFRKLTKVVVGSEESRAKSAFSYEAQPQAGWLRSNFVSVGLSSGISQDPVVRQVGFSCQSIRIVGVTDDKNVARADPGRGEQVPKFQFSRY